MSRLKILIITITVLSTLTLMACCGKIDNETKALIEDNSNKVIHFRIKQYTDDNKFTCSALVQDSVPASVLNQQIDTYVTSDLGYQYGIISFDELLYFYNKPEDEKEDFINFLNQHLPSYTDVLDRFLYYKEDGGYETIFVLGRKYADHYQVLGGPFGPDQLVESLDYDVTFSKDCVFTNMDGEVIEGCDNIVDYFNKQRETNEHYSPYGNITFNDKGEVNTFTEVYI